MPHQLFLSHDSRDRALANVLAAAITRITLAQITVWHSSDGTSTGGLRPGHVWLDEIRARLATSRAIVVLLTPTCISCPSWLLFESGFGAANPDCDVIPVCIGIDNAADLPLPLAMYQAYLLSDYESLKRFAEKLLGKYGIPFDEEMSRSVLTDAVRQLSQAADGRNTERTSRADLTLSNAIDELKQHIDKRLVSIIPRDDSGKSGNARMSRYAVQIDLNLRPGMPSGQFIEIAASTTVADVLDNIYFMLEGEVEAYSYLEQWVLRDSISGECLIIREVQSRIPASALFTPGSKWEVLKLDKPYTATDSPGKS